MNTDTPNIVLTGFMGTGKTAVGREIAAQLDRPFVDMDDLIVARTGMSIAEIFAQHGEAYFRSLESAIVRELAGQSGLVIASGGGALVDAANRELMTRTSLVVCLSASVSAIEDRIGGAIDRPLLAAADRKQRVVELMNQRAAAYAEIPYRIDTTKRSIAEVAREIIDLAQSGLGGILRLPVATPGEKHEQNERSYDIFIGSSLLGEMPGLLQERGLDGAVAVISDEHVAPFWADVLMASLSAGTRPTSLLTLPAGEAHKNLKTLTQLYDDLVGLGLDRRGVIVALGGGVVGDLAGFAAATYLRGVHLVQAPTSLLAMVDASVGGKTGVDLPQGKNLVGAFKQPELVVIDTQVLSTLPPAEFRNGLAEVVKHGIIADPELFDQLDGDGPDSLESLIARALRVKIGVVERDPYERGERAHLNLGHTFAHAFERTSGYGIAHGQAVAVGLLAASHLAAARGDCPSDLPGRVHSVLDRLGLPSHFTGLDPQEVLAAMATDKKRQGRRLRFVLPHAIGAVAVHDDVSEAQVMAALHRVLA